MKFNLLLPFIFIFVVVYGYKCLYCYKNSEYARFGGRRITNALERSTNRIRNAVEREEESSSNNNNNIATNMRGLGISRGFA